MAIPLGDVLLGRSSDRTRRGEWEDSCPEGAPSYLVLLRVGFTQHP